VGRRKRPLKQQTFASPEEGDGGKAEGGHRPQEGRPAEEERGDLEGDGRAEGRLAMLFSRKMDELAKKKAELVRQKEELERTMCLKIIIDWN